MYNFQRYLAIVFLLVLTFTVVVSCKPKETIQTTDDTTTQSDGDSNAVTTSDETTAEEETTATDTEPDPEKTAYQLFEEIMTPVYEAEAIDMSFNHEISYSLPGDTTYNYSYLGNTKSMIQDEKALVSTVMTLKMADITINTTSYFDGEFLYVNSGLEKIKMPMPPIEEEY